MIVLQLNTLICCTKTYHFFDIFDFLELLNQQAFVFCGI
ncbi:Unannotated [Lentimonas sp. CC19]|nr:Unannotated [Lentimonas sp. CC4]CAA6686838.1 Unannotated [Lentimonas sp. CC6]CAA6691202.1 Unannotated [Lentimonas sp. CC19]CAA6694770.1 Unannotated [Lentimonas sp. CC10]CAA7071581.1 Unannotated [Lentimonas sp. CC11]CAA7169155.1 Unannotated [Lentimonas sp. CC21]CAA7180444.1 Unannotated [Lentimonas sp. CC8]